MLARTRTLHRALGVAALVAVLAACGTETDGSGADEPTSTPTASETSDTGLPACSEIWVDGQDLPLDYEACEEGGEVVKPETWTCGFGRPMVTHADRFYAMPGNRVNDVGDLATSAQYKRAKRACLA